MNVALLGSTGLVGKNVLKLLVELDCIQHIYCPVRSSPDLREMGILRGASKVTFDVLDFPTFLSGSSMMNASNDECLRVCSNFHGCDAVFCCLGTTIKQAGSKPAQELVDVRLPLTFAALAKKQGVKHFLCVSAMGANESSPFFYNRLKGQLEKGLTIMGFDCLTLVRPSLLLGKHKDKRLGEGLMQKLFGKHPEWIPAYIRPVHAETVAAHLVTSMLKPPVGRVCASDGVLNKRIIYNRILAITKLEDFDVLG